MQNETIENWRKEIDTIDEQIINLLSKRMAFVLKIGDYKKKNKIAARDEGRWQALLNNLINKGEKHKLSKNFITDLYTVIHEYFIEVQKKL